MAPRAEATLGCGRPLAMMRAISSGRLGIKWDDLA